MEPRLQIRNPSGHRPDGLTRSSLLDFEFPSRWPRRIGRNRPVRLRRGDIDEETEISSDSRRLRHNRSCRRRNRRSRRRRSCWPFRHSSTCLHSRLRPERNRANRGNSSLPADIPKHRERNSLEQGSSRRRLPGNRHRRHRPPVPPTAAPRTTSGQTQTTRRSAQKYDWTWKSPPRRKTCWNAATQRESQTKAINHEPDSASSD